MMFSKFKDSLNRIEGEKELYENSLRRDRVGIPHYDSILIDF